MSPTPDISLRFRPTFLNWTHGADTTPGFFGCPVITSAEHVQSLPHQLLPSFPWLSCVLFIWPFFLWSRFEAPSYLWFLVFPWIYSIEKSLICDLVPVVFHHGLQLSAASAIASRQPLSPPLDWLSTSHHHVFKLSVAPCYTYDEAKRLRAKMFQDKVKVIVTGFPLSCVVNAMRMNVLFLLSSLFMSFLSAFFFFLPLCPSSAHPLTFRWLPHLPGSSFPVPRPTVTNALTLLLCRTFYFLMMLFFFFFF